MVGSIRYTDTHCHLDFHDFNGDREAVLNTARQSGLIRILDPGIDLETSRKAVSLSDEYDEVYAAIGIHPNSALLWDDGTFQALAELASHPKVVAIGEIGLDYYRNGAPADVQKRVFKAQLQLADSLGLPVVIHNRQATNDLLPILIEWQQGLVDRKSDLAHRPGVLHSFSGDVSTAEAAVSSNFFIGVTGPVTFTNAQVLQQVISSLHLDRMLVETDAPFLTPHPHRGKRNEPGYIPLIASKIAELHGVDMSIVAQKTTANAAQLLRWSEIA